MRTLPLLLLVLLLLSCRETPSQSDNLSHITAYVYFQSGVPNVPVVLVQTNDTLRTDTLGLATFSIPAGHYIIKAVGIHGGGPGFPITLADTVDTHPGDTTKVKFFDCLACVSAQREDDPGVLMTLNVNRSSGGPGKPVAINYAVLNGGKEHRQCFAGCSYRFAPGTTLKIIGPDSTEVFLSSPVPRMLCPDFMRPFEPGADFTASETFNGVLYTGSGEQFNAPSGVYTIETIFRSWVAGLQSSEEIFKRVTFEWKAE